LGKKLKESREKIDAVLSKEPENIEALFVLAGILELGKKQDEAVSVFEKIIKLNNREPRAYIEISRILARQGKLSEAEIILKKAVHFNPDAVSLLQQQQRVWPCRSRDKEGHRHKPGEFRSFY